MIHLSGRGGFQLLSGQLIESYLDEIEFDERSGLTAKWWPLGTAFPVVLDPHRVFGAPSIEGSRVRTDTAASLVRATDVHTAAAALQLTVREINAALKFETFLAAAA